MSYIPPSSIPELRRKLVIIGDGACGKTSLLMVYCQGRFPTVHIPTVFENTVTDIHVDGRHIELALWDTAGQEDYDRLRPLSYPDSHTILICFAIDSPDSLANIQEKWLTEVLYYCPNIPYLLIGCKKDLRSRNPNCITREQGFAVAQEIGARCYIECSAKTGEGVAEVFEYATRAALTALTGDTGSECDCCIIA
ncbi:GTP-binding protein Rho1 [Termitomyces sp. 'cryptogamus']|nr:GTP-binding protein Rho1 [Termitomyces sp. 'cryptogamus']